MRKILRFTAILVLVFSILIPQTFARAYYIRLDVPSQRQQKTLWCWAASSVSLATFLNARFTSGSGYLGAPITQYNHVMCALGNSDNVGRTFTEMKYDLEDMYGLFSYVGYEYCRIGPMLDSFEAGSPLLIRILWGNGLGHSIIATGIQERLGRDWVTLTELEILDPDTGEKHWLSYDTVISSYGDSGAGRWAGTMYNFYFY